MKNKIIFKTLMLKGEAGSTIVSMEKTGHVGTADIYTITFNDGSTTEISLENMSAITSVEKTSSTDTEDIYTITCADGSTQTFSVLNHNADIAAMSDDIDTIDARVDNFINSVVPNTVETLWTGSIKDVGDSATLSKAVSNFDYIDLYLLGSADSKYIRVPATQTAVDIQQQNLSDDASSNFLRLWEMGVSISGSTVSITKSIAWAWDDPNNSNPTVTANAQNGVPITRIDGVKVASSSPAELTDIRVGANGVTYASAGDSVRGQYNDLNDNIMYALNEIRSNGTINIFNHETLQGRSGITFDKGVFEGKASDFYNFVLLDSGFEENTPYTISFVGKNTGSNVNGSGIGIYVNYSDSTHGVSYLANNSTSDTVYTVTTASNKTVTSIKFDYNSDSANVWQIKNIQIEKGNSASGYVPYFTANDRIARELSSLNETDISNIASKALKNGEITISSTNIYQSFDDLPLNKVVNIIGNTTLNNGPDGYDYIGHNNNDTGKYDATVITFGALSANNRAIVQLCYMYNANYDFTKQARIAMRYAIKTNNVYVWSDWSIMSNDSFLHSSNKVVDINSYQTVTFGDFNDAPANAIYQVDFNTGSTVLNNPSPGHSGLLMTFAFSPITRHALVQQHFALEDDDIAMYVRYSYKQSATEFNWTPWKKVAFVSA